MYTLKQIPEDFIVKEKSIIASKKRGRFTYFLLKKKNYNTIDLLQLIAKKIGLPLKRFGFAGNKDRVAITEQVCSVQELGFNIESVQGPGIAIKFLGKGDKPVCLGDLEGNYFEITVRNLEKAPASSKEFINYFGEQRFSRNNAEIGKAMLKRDFEKACILVDQHVVNDFLENNPTNHIAALRQLPKKLLRLYIHSYQSFLWNQTVKELIKNNIQLPKEIPIIGFDTEIGDEERDKVIQNLIKKGGITFRDFIIKEFPELSAEGGSRRTMARAEELVVNELEEDEINENKKKCKISFFLKKGCYATEFIRQLFEVKE